MINTDKLRGIISERGMTQPKVAKAIGITPKTFYDKMKKGVLSNTEIEALTELLKIEKPASVFFHRVVAWQDTQQTRLSEAGTTQ